MNIKILEKYLWGETDWIRIRTKKRENTKQLTDLLV